ncbi:MAG: hypothetical protein JWN12_349 [Candidatus Saccharibacteria bacterium]|nr:hypothetical protein [Candidatus Saccharibacteria bacterium]
MKRYWPLVFVPVLFAVPTIVLVICGVPLNDALRAVSIIHAPVLGLTYTYKSGDDIILAAILLLILGFVVFSIARYLHKKK